MILPHHCNINASSVLSPTPIDVNKYNALCVACYRFRGDTSKSLRADRTLRVSRLVEAKVASEMLNNNGVGARFLHGTSINGPVHKVFLNRGVKSTLSSKCPVILRRCSSRLDYSGPRGQECGVSSVG